LDCAIERRDSASTENGVARFAAEFHWMRRALILFFLWLAAIETCVIDLRKWLISDRSDDVGANHGIRILSNSHLERFQADLGSSSLTPFTISASMSQGSSGDLYKFVIPKRMNIDLKRKFMVKLQRMNITGFSLFPDIDGVGRYCADIARYGLAPKYSDFHVYGLPCSTRAASESILRSGPLSRLEKSPSWSTYQLFCKKPLERAIRSGTARLDESREWNVQFLW